MRSLPIVDVDLLLLWLVVSVAFRATSLSVTRPNMRNAFDLFDRPCLFLCMCLGTRVFRCLSSDLLDAKKLRMDAVP